MTVMKMSPIFAASLMGITRKPSITASRPSTGIDFGDDHVRAVPLGAHRDAFAAPTVTGNNHAKPAISRFVARRYAVKRGLAGAVAIVEKMLGERVIHGDDRNISACRLSPWRADESLR